MVESAKAIPKVLSTSPGRRNNFHGLLDVELSSPIVVLKVGKEAIEFYAHQDVLFHSGYFGAVLESRFEETTTKTFVLEEEEPEVFGLLIDWMYDGEDCLVQGGIAQKPQGYDLILLKLWLLADMRLVPALKNTIINILHHTENDIWGDFWPDCFLSPLSIARIWPVVPESSGLHKYILDFIVTVDFQNTPMQEMEYCPHIVLVQALQRIAELRFEHRPCARKWFAGLDPCRYHDHADGIDCSATMNIARLPDDMSLEELTALFSVAQYQPSMKE